MTVTPTNPATQESILVITGPDSRHQYFVNQVNAHFPLAAVFTEDSDYPSPEGNSAEEKDAWDWFFTRRAAYENQVFGATNRLATLNDPETLRIEKGQLNFPENLKRIQQFQPGFIALYGTGMVKDPILNQFPGRIFNLHVGLPGFYRGSSCNFWPIHDHQLDKLGATVHLTNRGIDKGEFAAQSTIELAEHDDEQTLAGKTLILGTRLMIETIRNWQNGTLNLSPLTKPGKLYLKKDFAPAAVLKVRKMVESGELKQEIKKVRERRKKI